ncbi:PadR family transcriptional regulator [Micromonospora sp. HM5-17]|uniref:PadR family transcriptional regulator n=1 Tax=Micromonospora sp. HM5-17 TaxID=2487710 RepID=UPI000F4847C3|nr:PadR family transcriptional regulator [Micromonospora sp. HM5-17]ROT33689.1 PadR family transcriptional regulator [Micromonospora sp. HM5-17]
MATVSPLGYALLCTLHRGPLTGYEIVRRMRKPIGYYWTAQQSQIYPELARLSAAGLITHDAEAGPGPRQRKTHRLTDAGRAALAAWLVEPPAPRAPRDEAVLKTYALAAADPARMREFYLAEAEAYERRHEDFRAQHADLVSRNADDVQHPQFGAYATLELALATGPVRIAWYRWLAEKMAELAERGGPPQPAGAPPGSATPAEDNAADPAEGEPGGPTGTAVPGADEPDSAYGRRSGRGHRAGVRRPRTGGTGA